MHHGVFFKVKSNTINHRVKQEIKLTQVFLRKQIPADPCEAEAQEIELPGKNLKESWQKRGNRCRLVDSCQMPPSS